jgi:hypothetical protein
MFDRLAGWFEPTKRGPGSSPGRRRWGIVPRWRGPESSSGRRRWGIVPRWRGPESRPGRRGWVSMASEGGLCQGGEVLNQVQDVGGGGSGCRRWGIVPT